MVGADGSLSTGAKEKLTPALAAPTRPRRTFVWVMVIVLILIVAAVAGAWAAGLIGKKQSEKVLVVGMADDITTMDAAKANWMFGPACVIYDTLLTTDTDGNYKDGLAESWETNETDLIMTLHLKHGVKFHDGTSFNAEAVKWNVEYLAEGFSGYEFDSVDTVWAKDEYTAQLNLSYIDVSLPFYLSNIYTAMASPTAVQTYGDSYGTGTYVVGTGPFKILEWIPGDHVTVVKNENYSWAPSWMSNRGAAHLDKIVYRIVPDEAARFLGFESGDTDVLMSVPPYKLSEYQARKDVQILNGQGQGLFYIEFNCERAPWDNATLRKSIGFAIDRTEILKTVWHDIGSEAWNYLPPIMPETKVDPSLNFSYDPEKSTDLLGAVGYADSDSDVWVEKDGEELTLRLWTTTRGEDISMAEILKDQIEAVGVHVSISHYADQTLLDMCSRGDQDCMIYKDSWCRADILDWFFGAWAIPYPNTAHFNDSVFDECILNGYTSPTQDNYTYWMTKAHERALTLSPWAPLIYWDQIHAVHSWVKGWTLHSMGQETVQDLVDVDIKR